PHGRRRTHRRRTRPARGGRPRRHGGPRRRPRPGRDERGGRRGAERTGRRDRRLRRRARLRARRDPRHRGWRHRGLLLDGHLVPGRRARRRGPGRGRDDAHRQRLRARARGVRPRPAARRAGSARPVRGQNEAMTAATLYRNGRCYSPADPTAAALLVRDGRIAWLGADADAPSADRTVDLDGALITPAFVDAHVHTTATGLALLGLDVSGTPSRAALLDAVAAHAAGLAPDAVLVGHGWDESTWADQAPPDAAALD